MALKLSFYLTLLWLVAIASLENPQNNDKQNLLNPMIHDLFRSLDKNPTPLYLCKGYASGVLWNIFLHL